MSRTYANSILGSKKQLIICVTLCLALLVPFPAFSRSKKKKNKQPQTYAAPDYSMIVWPNPPAIARIKFQDWYAAQKLSQVEKPNSAKKSRWMDKLAGTQPEQDRRPLFQLNQPFGIAVDSKGNVYTADQKVGAIFIFNTETKEAELIKNKVDAHFVHILGLAMDDGDRLFVSDAALRHVLVLNPQHKPEASITEGMAYPGELAIDKENRFLYVSDVALDQVLVYDADTYKLIRKIGTTGHNHALTTPGNFSKPTGLAVDKDGNLYVADTMNDRIEEFDADGQFIREFGKNGDGPGEFGRPKGVAIDSDGNIWVADGMFDRIQVFNQDLQLLIIMGTHGELPGEFQGLVNIFIDNHNRVFTTEIYPGRLQQFRYVTESEFQEEKKRRDEKAAEKGLPAGTIENTAEKSATAGVAPTATK